jgi:hypothetical protein
MQFDGITSGIKKVKLQNKSSSDEESTFPSSDS